VPAKAYREASRDQPQKSEDVRMSEYGHSVLGFASGICFKKHALQAVLAARIIQPEG
jgi:hypothetical protein